MDTGVRAASGTGCRGIQKGGPGSEGTAEFAGWRVGRQPLKLSFPRYGNGLCKPLDSGLRRAATGILGGSFQTPLYRLRPVCPACCRQGIQGFLSINDGGAEVRHLSGIAKRLSGWRQTHSDLRRHSSEGWNPGRGCRIGDGMAGFIGCPRLVIMPVYWHSCCAGMACLNHWIPAFAGRLRASSAARSRRRSTAYVL